MENIILAITNYVSSLDWTYILTFILLAYLINQEKVRIVIQNVLHIKTSTRYRIALTGLLLGIALYFIRDYTLDKIECLFNSFVFTLVFHKLLLDGLMQYVTGKKGESEQSQNNS